MSPRAFDVPADPEPIRATFFPPAGPERLDAILVLGHGAGAGQASPFIVNYATALAARGLATATFDFTYMARGRKTPDRAPVLEATFRQAVRGVLSHEAAGGHRVFIGGKSMGGRIATHLGADAAAWASDVPGLAGIVVLGYPLAPPGGRRSGDRVSHLKRLQVPTLIVQGTRDAFGGPDEVREAVFSDGATPTIRIVPVEGGDHSFAVLKSAGRDQGSVHADVQDAILTWVSDTAGR